MSVPVVIAAINDDIADFLASLILVYTLLIFAYIVLSLVLGIGGRSIPYGIPSKIYGFLVDVVEPYLRIFRRFIPPLGPIDVSPIVGVLVLQIVGGIIVSLIRG